MNQDMLELIKGSASIPTLPQVVTRFIELSADPDCKLEDLVEVLSTDPGIAAELLRLTNSALFGLARKVSSLKQAVVLLGMARVRTLVLGRYLVERMQQLPSMPEPFSYAYYWRRSLTQAVLASRLAEHLAPRYREQAFVAGLLADAGVVILAQAMPDRYGPILSEYAPLRGDDLADREREQLGITHADVSALVLEKWMLPEEVVQAVRRHHDAFSDVPKSREDQLRGIVAAADAIAKLLCERPDPVRLARTCRAAMEGLGLDLAGLARILDRMHEDIEAFAGLLGVSVIQSKLYNRVIELVQQELAGQPAAT